MRMRALIMGETQKKQIADLKALAATRVFNAEKDFKFAANNPEVWRHLMEALTIEIPNGFTVTYSQEKQSPGLFHHISISVDRIGMAPSFAAAEMILEAFDLKPLDQSDSVWMEDLVPGVKAVNIVQRMAS